MKAWVLEDVGDIQYKEAAKPHISENEVLVAVKAAGICGSDIPRIYRDRGASDAADTGTRIFRSGGTDRMKMPM
ncbi:MAG: hypothetical protein ACLRWA_06340 [Lachnospira sp.]